MHTSLLSLLTLLLVLASLTSSSSKGTSVQDPHSRELHGTSTRKLLEKMIAAAGGHITDNDIGVLFLRYQREFNRSYSGGGELSRALAGFTESARTIARLQDQEVEFGISEVSDMSAADWVSSWKGGARRLRVPFAQQNMGQDGARIDSQVDWRHSLVPPFILQANRSAIPSGIIHGQLAALGGCLDALLLREASDGAPPLPNGGFGHIAAHHAPLAAALTPISDAGSPFPSGVLRTQVDGAASRWSVGDAHKSAAAAAAAAAAAPPPALPEHLQRKLEKKRMGGNAAFKHVPFNQGPGHADESECASLGNLGSEGGWGEALAWALAGEIEFRWVAHGDELMLQRALGRGPVAVSFDALDPRLQHYRSGVYSGWEGCSKRGSTHAFLLVAQGADERGRYWVLKSSLGRSWGEGGYLRVRMGGNICGIATAAVYAAKKGEGDY